MCCTLSNINFRASEKKREILKISVAVFFSVTVTILILGTALAVTISALKSDISDLSGALVQLNFSSTVQREEMNKSLAMKLDVNAKTVANQSIEVEAIDERVAEMQVQNQRVGEEVADVQAQNHRITKVHQLVTLPLICPVHVIFSFQSVLKLAKATKMMHQTLSSIAPDIRDL